MSEQTAQLLQAFEALPAEEKQFFLQQVLRHAPSINLQERGIDAAQAADLRGRLKTFAEDWDRPEASIYDEDSAR